MSDEEISSAGRSTGFLDEYNEAAIDNVRGTLRRFHVIDGGLSRAVVSGVQFPNGEIAVFGLDGDQHIDRWGDIEDYEAAAVHENQYIVWEDAPREDTDE